MIFDYGFFMISKITFFKCFIKNFKLKYFCISDKILVLPFYKTSATFFALVSWFPS